MGPPKPAAKFELVNIGPDRKVFRPLGINDYDPAGLFCSPASRIREVRHLFQDSQATAANLLCDRYDPQKVACCVVSQQRRAIDLTQGDLREQSECLAVPPFAPGVRSGDRLATFMGQEPRLSDCNHGDC